MAKKGFKAMDSDLHVIEPVDMWERYLEPEFRKYAPRIYRPSHVTGAGLAVFQGMAFPTCDVNTRERYYGMGIGAGDDARAPMRAQNHNGRSQLDAMNIEGLDIGVNFPTVGLYLPLGVDNIDPEVSWALCRAWNNWIYDFCEVDRKRMKACAVLPMHDPFLAAKEARRAVNELGAVATFIRPNFLGGHPWHSRYWDPVWATLQELDIAIGLHEGTGTDYFQDGSEFGENRLMRHACSHPVGMMKAMISMICGGVFEAFPRLKVAFLEANTGWLPYWLSRMDRDYKNYGKYDAPQLKLMPKEYFMRNCWIGCEGDDTELKYVIDAVGDDNIVFSTDFPHHDTEFPHAIDEFLELEIADESKRKILWDNCAKLYGLDSAGQRATEPIAKAA
jgi:predicted TIM-barrel fold metal-dependent hydrolase